MLPSDATSGQGSPAPWRRWLAPTRRGLAPLSGARFSPARLALLAVTLAALIGGTWAVQSTTIERLLREDAVSSAHGWARYLANNVDDLGNIAAGQRPSPESLAFFARAQEAGNVFRYKIFSLDGQLRLVSDELTALGTDAQNLSEHNPAAAAAIAAGRPLVVAKEGKPPARPDFFTEAYVGAVDGVGKTIAIVEAYVDQTEKRAHFRAALKYAAASLSVLMALAFAIPAAAWYVRTRDKQRDQAHIRFLAYHDDLTALPNRNRLTQTIEQGLTAAVWRGGQLALHCINVDHFKTVNDALGHGVGDGLIMAVAERLRTIAGPGDTVARLGGDEFALLQGDVDAHAEAEAMAGRVVDAMARPFAPHGHDIAVTTSLGFALAPADGASAEQLLRSADLAMHASKRSGGNCARAFAPDMEAELQARLALEKAIREATLDDGFELHFQPIVGVPGGQLVGFEALLRLRTADGGFIAPAEFIPVAEQMGLIDAIGACVVQEACREAASWPQHLYVAVNLSPMQFSRSSVRDVVAGALAETGIKAHRLELEITESLLLEDTGNVLAELSGLKALGVTIVMDDFGTGYSSLSYLWRFPFDKIKIDRSFMRGFDAAEKDARTIVNAIVALARSLDLRVTVEGVETRRQLEFVHEMRCDEVQGFLLGQPMPATELAAWILEAFQETLHGQPGAQAAARSLRVIN